MKSYAEREIFGPRAIELWQHATVLVARIDERHGNEVRCHELSRAVARVLQQYQDPRDVIKVIDGKFGIIEHSWILLDRLVEVSPKKSAILDVYVPGRCPQVQLIDTHFVVAQQYKPGQLRVDIDDALVDLLFMEMMHV